MIYLYEVPQKRTSSSSSSSGSGGGGSANANSNNGNNNNANANAGSINSGAGSASPGLGGANAAASGSGSSTAGPLSGSGGSGGTAVVGSGLGGSGGVAGDNKKDKKKQTADMYLIYTHKLSNNTAEITAHPHLKYRICEKVFWSHWDSKRELLYILEPRKAAEEKGGQMSANSRGTTCVLTCYHFQDKKPNALVKYATDIQLGP
jgi:hypothetical protein